MLPKTLALIDDDHDYAQALSSHLQALGVAVEVFGDSNERATPVTVPLQTKSGVGYVFRAPLKVV